MGCNLTKPIPAGPVQKSSEPRTPPMRRQGTKRKTLSTNEISSISQFYEIISVLGSTSIGTLLRAKDIHTGTTRTIHEVCRKIAKESSELYQEVNILNDLDHPNILKVFNTVETSRSYYIVLESTDGGTLQSRIKKSCNEVLVSKYMQSVFSGINYMHLHGVIHCDLHIGNILMSDSSPNAIPKISGFTYAQKASDIQFIDISYLNYEYISPDILEEKFDEKTDIWSAGIILYQLLVGKLPFTSKNKKEILEAIYKGDLDYNDPNFVALSKNAQDLIQKLLNHDPEARISAKEALGHIWLQQNLGGSGITYEIVQKMRKFKLNYAEHDIITLFKKMDVNFDGNISKDEMVIAFKEINVDCEDEVDSIMNNLDMDMSGALDFSELKVVLVDWDKELKRKNLAKVFAVQHEGIALDTLKHELPAVLPSEWYDFCKKVKVENGFVTLQRLKEYIRANLIY